MADLNEHAFTAALDAVQDAFQSGQEEEGQARAAISAYLDALPTAEKPARVEPDANPNKKSYVCFQAANPNRVCFEHAGDWYGDLNDASANLVRRDLVTGIKLLCAVTHTASWNAGWYHDPKTGQPIERNVGEVIALMHSELSEALEGYRKGLMDDHLPNRLQIEVEFADTVIRIADTCGHLGLDLAGAIVDKMRYNATREDHKLEARANGGKSF